LIEGTGHIEWMFDDNPHCQARATRFARWLDALLEKP
jgi:hypothetical protein